MKQANVERAKSVAGILLIGAGILLFREHLSQTMTHVNHLLGNVPGGMLPMVVMDEAQQTWQTSSTDRVLQHILQQIFASAWPLLLVRIGMGLSAEFRR